MTKAEEKALLKKYAEVNNKLEAYATIKNQKLIRIRRNLKKVHAHIDTKQVGLLTKTDIKKILKPWKDYEKWKKKQEANAKALHRYSKKQLKGELLKKRQRMSDQEYGKLAELRASMIEAENRMEAELRKLDDIERASRNVYTEAMAIKEAVEERIVEQLSSSPHMADKAQHLYNATLLKFKQEPEMEMLYLLRWKMILGDRTLMRILDRYFYGSDPWQTYRVGDDLYSNPAFQGDITNVDAWDDILQTAFDPLSEWGTDDINEAFITYLEM